jgi:hypothetical protein
MSKIISFEKLLEIPIDDMKMICNNFIQKKLGLNVYCVEFIIFSPNESISRDYYSYRNFFEFKDTFELYIKKYPDNKFPEFPSRIAFTKAQEESRMKFFHMFLNKILEEAKNENKTEDILNILYNFIFGQKDVIYNKLTKEKIKIIFNKDVQDSDIIDDDTNDIDIHDSQNQSSNEISNSPGNNNKNNSNFLEILNSDNKLPILDKILSPEDNKLNNSVNLNLSFTSNNENSNKSIEKDSLVNFNKIKKSAVDYVNEKFNLFLGNKNKSNKDNKENKEKKESKENKENDSKGIFDGIRKSISSKIVANYIEENNIWENIYVKTSLKDYCLHKVKIKDKLLFLTYEETNNNIIDDEDLDKKIIGLNDRNRDNDFYLIVPLYKINIELFRIIYPPLLSDDKTLKSIPEYNKEVRISSSEIYELEKYSPLSSLSEINSEIIMKLYHDYDRFETLIKFGQDWKISAIKNFLFKIEESSYLNKIKSIYIDEIIESNMDSFGNIMIDIINFSAPYFRGKIKIKICLEPYSFTTKSVISNASFDFNQKFLIPKHNRFKYLKFYIYKTKEGGLIIKKDEDKLISTYEIPLPKLINIYHLNKDPIEIKLKPTKEKAKKKKLKYTNMSLKFKCIDYSSLLALLVKNTNKRILDNYSLYNKEGDYAEEPYTMSVLLKRIKRVLRMFDDVYGFYQMLKYFKYPVISSFFWLLVIFYTFFCDPRYYMTHTVVFVICILFYYSGYFQNYIFPKLKPILFYIGNKYDTHTNLAITEKRKDRDEVAQNDYLIKKKGFFIPSIKEIKGIKHTYMDLIFRLSRIASFFEKFKNLFFWTDPLLSLYMTIILILFVLVTWKIEFRFLVCFSVSKKFLYGIFYYKNKLINNKEIARIVINDVFEIWKKEKEKEDKKEKKDKKENKEKKIEKKIIKIMERKTIDNEKLKNILKVKLYEQCNIILSEKFFDKMKTLGDVIEELGKMEEILKIKRLSYLFKYTKNNSKIFQKDIDPEDIFYYFIQNIKSDYYMAENGFIKTDYFKNENIIGEELDIKKNLNRSISGNIPEDINNKINENK